MIKKICIIAAGAYLLAASNVFAADVLKRFSIKEAEQSPVVQDSLDGDIAMYWATGKHPAVAKRYGTFTSSKRTNGLGKQPVDSCARALASALIAFQDRARREGGNAVIDLKSNIKGREEASAVEYSCLVGTMMVNVALKGTVVTLEK